MTKILAGAPGYSLADVRRLVDESPVEVSTNVDLQTAQALVTALQAAGADAEALTPSSLR